MDMQAARVRDKMGRPGGGFEPLSYDKTDGDIDNEETMVFTIFDSRGHGPGIVPGATKIHTDETRQ